MKRRLAFVVLAVFAAGAFAAFAGREETIDGQLEPHRVDDTTAWELLFTLLKAGDKRWFEEKFMENWFAEGGLTNREVFRVIGAAWQYWYEVNEIDNEIFEITNKGRDDKKVEGLVKLKKAKLYGEVMQMARDLETMERVNRFLHEEIKKHTTSTQQGALRSLLPMLYAQTMTSSVSRTVVMSRSGRWVVSKAAASTGGAFGHKVKVTAKATSPSGRTATATSSIGYSVTSSAYLDLCGLNCEDGWYSSSLVTNVFCNYGGQFPASAMTGPKTEAKKFTTLLSVRFASVGSTNAPTVTTMPKQNGRTYLVAKIGKSTTCTAVNALASDRGQTCRTDPSTLWAQSPVAGS